MLPLPLKPAGMWLQSEAQPLAKTCPPFLTAVHAARRTAAAISASSTGVSSVGIQLAFAAWFLQRDSC